MVGESPTTRDTDIPRRGMYSVPGAGASPPCGSYMQNGPSSSTSTSDLHNSPIHYSSDNDSETEDKILQKEISRLREKHMMEIQAMQSRQKQEIQALFTQMGKCPPPSVSPALVMARGQRTRKSHKSCSSGQPSSLHSRSPASAQSLHDSESPPKQSSPSATEASQAVSRSSIDQLRSSPSMPSLSGCSTGSSRTSSTNGSGQNHSTSLTQATGPTPAFHTQKGKGTFTDDLHQLVDNWARDAISLSQCKKGPKTGTQEVLGHDIIPPVNMGRKFSAPGYLCPTVPMLSIITTTHLPDPTNPSVPLGPCKGSLGPVAPGFGNSSAPYSAPQWAGPTGTCQVGMLNPAQPLTQYQPSTPASVSLQQGYHMGTTPAPQKSVSPGGSNLRPTSPSQSPDQS